jgi:HIRAN domain
MKALVALVGMKHRGTEKLVESLPLGEPLTLIREPTNQYDANAVQVWARDQHVGYVKSSQNRDLAASMDRAGGPGMPMMDASGRIQCDGQAVRWVAAPKKAKLAIDGGKWPMVEVEVEVEVEE